MAILLSPTDVRIPVTVLMTILLLAGAGAVASKLGRSRVWRGALRVTAGGAIAMAVTWGIGRMLGVEVG